MRAVALQHDVLVITSSLWMTTAVALRSGDEAFLIDSPYFPDELDALPALLAQAGFELKALLSTHADFDHLLARLAFPELPLGVGEPTALRLRAEPGAAQRELRAADADHYVKRERPLSLGAVQSLPVPGRLDIGESELELHPAEGHTADGTAFLSRSAGVLVCGDYLSDVEIPTVHSIDDYRATLARLERLLDAVETVVPGHGRPLRPDDAKRIAAEDAAYLDALAADAERPPLPKGRDTPRQRELHRENLERRLRG